MLVDGRYLITADGKVIDRKSHKTLLLPKSAREAIKSVKSGKRYLKRPAGAAKRSKTFDLMAADPQLLPKELHPRGTCVLETNPLLSWKANDGVHVFMVQLLDDKGNSLWDGTIEDFKYQVEPNLDRDRTYHWRVGSEVDGKTYYAEPAPFRVLNEDEAAAVRSTVESFHDSHFVKGTIYERYGMYEQALEEYRALLKENPKSFTAKNMIEALEKTQAE
jgi:tetratricopeptide (TPR) repeat protein